MAKLRKAAAEAFGVGQPRSYAAGVGRCRCEYEGARCEIEGLGRDDSSELEGAVSSAE